MYNIWSKLTKIEDVLLGNADEAMDYLKTNYFTPVQQIRAMFSERAAQLKRDSFQKPTTNSCSFRILSEGESQFDPVCNYIGFILYSYEGKSPCSINGQQYQCGDILIKDIDNIPNSSSRLKSPIGKQEDYNNLYKSLINSTFKKASYDRFEGLGIIYERYKWKFDVFIIGTKLKQSPFSLDEKLLFEMYILSWTKNMNDQVSICDDARKMLDEQLDYVKELLQTQRDDMEKIWTPKEVEIAIKTFEHEIQDEIDALFQTTPAFNTFADLRDKVQSNQEHRLSLVAEIFEHRLLTEETQPAELSLYEVWTQLKLVENWLREKDFNSLVNFLNLNTFSSIESLFSAPVPLFINRLGICPESDIFDPTLNYIGFLIYLYNDQDELTVNIRRCKRGQVLIRQKEKFCRSFQTLNHHQTSFEPLFIHEYLYEWYFREKPNERFQGIGFVYEQNKWKFDVITYAGKHGIYSIYDSLDDNPMASSSNEQYAVDLILSTIYIHNKWKKEAAGRMHAIKDLQSIGRELFQKEIEIIEELFQVEENDEASFNKTCQFALKNFLDQYRPKPVVPEKKKPVGRTTSQDSQSKDLKSILKESKSDGNSEQSTATLTNSDANGNSKQSKSMGPLLNDPEKTQPSTSVPNSNPPVRIKKIGSVSKPKNSFFNGFDRLRRISSLTDLLSTSKTRSPSSSSASSTEPEEVSPPINKKPQKKISIPTKETITLYQLWRELKDAEQKILDKPDLNQFLDYLTNQEYVNYNASVHFTPPENQIDEYNLMAKIKIDSQLQFLSELFELKKVKIFQKLSDQEEQYFDNLFNAFEKHYIDRIKSAKKYSK